MLLQMARSSFAWLRNISLYTDTAFFIHSSISEHLGCFNSLAVVNNAAMNMRVCMSFSAGTLDFCNKYPELELMGHMVVLFFFNLIYLLLFFCFLGPNL